VTDTLLREKVALLLRRDRELLELRQRYARTLGWLEAAEQMSVLARRGRAEVLADEWPQIVVARLKLQSASLWRVHPHGESLYLVSHSGGAAPGPDVVTPPGFAERLAAEPDGIDNGEEPSALGERLGIRRFMWNTFTTTPGQRFFAVAGYNDATWRFHAPFTREDLSFARMIARMLEALLGQLRLIGDLTSEREHLRELNEELTQRDRELRRMQEELMESTRLAAVGEIAGLTAHEVLNPITSIQGRVTRMLGAQDETFDHNQKSLAAVPEAWARSLARGGPAALAEDLAAASPMGGTLADEDVDVVRDLAAYFGAMFSAYRDDLGFLLREIRRVTHIVDGMRGLSRRRTSAVPTPLRELIFESFEVLTDSFQKRRIAPSLLCEGEPWVEVDRYECIQVLTNLLRNAMLAIDERGAGAGAVRVRVEEDERRARVHVEDDGVGIEPEHEPHLFEMRFSTRADSAGTGLGLCIARRLVRGWQGDLHLAWTRPGEGSCFLVDLPLAQPPEPRRDGRD
jgi:signal transduction histidine kinase